MLSDRYQDTLSLRNAKVSRKVYLQIDDLHTDLCAAGLLGPAHQIAKVLFSVQVVR